MKNLVSFSLKVERYLAKDKDGEVFGRPDQVDQVE